ncbi:MAG: hypothetical protein BMS9Abin36_1392 [Gammaproteobacteria bacterium]|nr:MAG: hypothetical protein BMS9Abin36_1392 [Gammaproteobacteria bacterium]
MKALTRSLNQVIPWLSAYDQPEVAEGALDPLGLYSIADALTVNRLCPGVRERQKHPGFLVPIAIGASLAEEYTGQYSEINNVSPIQIFEWYVVQALVGSYRHKDPARLTGLPGRDKVSHAIDQFGCVAAESYLKTPSVFGFYGVYKLLARKLEILYEDKTSHQCPRLVAAWEQDQNHIIRNREAYFKLSREGIDYGLENEKTQKHWKHWQKFAEPMVTHQPGPKVSALLWEFLIDEREPLRSEYFQFLVNEGADIWLNSDSDESEQVIHRALIEKSSPAMKALLETIQRYEEFSRLVTDAFYHILYAGSQAERSVGINELTGLDSVTAAAKRLPQIQTALEEGLHAHEVYGSFAGFQELFSSTGSAGDWVNALLDHHVINQQNKPPNGKMPFIERYDGGAIRTRTAYCQNEPPKQSGHYVHAYRLTSLWSFAVDIGKASNA